jgi:hypothetical protein
LLFFSKCFIFLSSFQDNPPVAQMVEQLPFKEMVAGSIPAGGTIQLLMNNY